MNNNTSTGGSFRVKRNPFAQVSNAALRDNNLSLKAKGLYSLIQSYITMPGFTLYKGHLMNMCQEKEKAFNSAWKELKTTGYLKQYRIPKGKNDSFVYEYELLDIADPTTPALVNLNKSGEEIKGNDENTDLDNENSHTPHLVPYAKGTLCQVDDMPKAPYANRWGNKDIDLNNIGLKNIYDTYTESKSESESKSGQPTTTNPNPETQTQDMTLTNDSDPDHAKQVENTDIKKVPPHTATQTKPNDTGSTDIDKRYSMDKYTAYLELIQDNIDYDYFAKHLKTDIDLIDEIINCMLDVILTDGNTVRIGGEDKHRGMIISQYLKLNYTDIELVIDRYKEQRHKITHISSYLKTMLYTVRLENGHYYTNAVRADGVVH